jgi:chromate transport protein ChrA
MIQQLTQDFLLFLRDPKQAEIYTPIAVKKFIFLLIVTLVLIIPSALLIEWVGLDQFNSVIEEMMKDNKWLVAILAIFLAPIIEEPIFRLHLDLKKSSIWWGIGLSVFIVSEQWFIAVGFVVYMI